ncbi:MAG: glycosyltransferase family 4 protein [Bacteroidota bacterium]|nr:glycosyltransferase family 4 protein [Bacteroidota bacterium]
MKVTLINTSDAGGGAPVACMRLLKALTLKKVDAGLLVKEKKTSDSRVTSVNKGLFSRIKTGFNLLYERVPFILFKAKNKTLRFAFSTANAGTDISDRREILGADILHLHWINFGYLSINDLRKLFQTGKPVVWTLHDMWAFTGGCHYSGDCDHFEHHCGDCWMLRHPNEHDLSFTGWKRKSEMYKEAKNMVFVTCSHWLAGVARTSSLLKNFRIETIPNPIDTAIFLPKEKANARKKWNISPTAKIILFGAANIIDRRKGISYLIEALSELKKTEHEQPIEIVIFGKNKSFDASTLPFKVHELNMITAQDDLVSLYSLADVFVTPAIEDNLPNTVMESLACGTPVVAFNTGGIPDMVDHQKNGYLAEFKSSADLAIGLHYVLNAENTAELSANARKKVLDNFTNEIVAAKYLELYHSILKNERV